jgi:hypothetical protein
MTVRLAASAAALALLLATPSVASITITANNVSGNPDENVLLSNDATSTSIVGLTNQTDTPVLFRGDELLTDPPNGQARIEAVDGGFDFLEISLQQPGGLFSELEFNLMSGFDGDVTITAIDNFGTEFDQTLTLDANGENRINLFSADDQLIRLVRINAEGDLEDIRQVRIGGFATAPIPEPATWTMMILGFGMAGAAVRRRRSMLA